MIASTVVSETRADLEAHHVHAKVHADGHEHLVLEYEAGTEQVERDAAAAIFWRHLHPAAEVH